MHVEITALFPSLDGRPPKRLKREVKKTQVLLSGCLIGLLWCLSTHFTYYKVLRLLFKGVKFPVCMLGELSLLLFCF